MAERDATVVAVVAGRIHLRLDGDACRGCGGCGGRCQLFATAALIELPADAQPAPAPGAQVCVFVDDAALRRLAWWGYGRALVGLLAGALLGLALARLAGWPADLLVAAGLLVGTLAPGAISKPALPEPRWQPARASPRPMT